MIDLHKLADYEEQKLKMMSAAEIFRYFCMKMLSADYVMGKENIFETDCSGTICFPLFAMDLNIRCTAHYLYTHIFIHPAGDIRDYLNRVLAVFYGRSGNITHVSPIVGRGVILDAVEPDQPVQTKAAAPVIRWYEDHNYNVHLREIDWEAARLVARMEEHSWDREADEMLKELVR